MPARTTEPPGPRRRLQAPERRELILRAAAAAFASSGYEHTRVPDVAGAAGVSEPVVFQHFGTKADLFAAVLDRAAGEFTARLAAALADTADPGALLWELASVEHVERLHAPGGVGALFAEAVAVHTDERIRDATRRTIGQVAEALTGVVARAQAHGSIRPDVSPAVAAWLLLSLLRARGFRRVVLAERFDVLEPALLRHALDALRPPLREDRGSAVDADTPGGGQ